MPIYELLDILRAEHDAEAAWRQALDLLRNSTPSDLWDALPAVDIQRDIKAVAAWLQGALNAPSVPVGVYLGLDTLNMNAGSGYNVEIGWKTSLNLEHSGVDWIYSGLEYGAPHLIEGLYELHAIYARPEWAELFSSADYMLFLGYSGIVLSAAIRSTPLPRPLLASWGFHDGDMFLLGLLTEQGFTTVAKLPTS